jgi:hypothetical protein
MMTAPIPPMPQWFADAMTEFRDGVIAIALAIEAEESGAAAKSSVDAADTIRRLSRERPDILRRVLAGDPYAGTYKPPAGKPRRQRKPSIKRKIAAAERSGKSVTSVTTPDGVTLHFDKAKDTEAKASNPWLADLDNKVTKQ